MNISWGSAAAVSLIVAFLGIIGTVQISQEISEKPAGTVLSKKEQFVFTPVIIMGALGLYGLGVSLIGAALGHLSLLFWATWPVVFLPPLAIPYFLFLPICELPEKISKFVEKMKEKKEKEDDGLDDLIASKK